MTLIKKLMLCGVAVFLVVLYIVLETGGSFTGDAAKTFDIEKGMGFYEIVNGLSDNDFISSSFGFKLYARTFHSGKLSKISTGKVIVSGRRSYGEIMNILVHGERENEDIRVTIPECYELREIADLLEEKGLINRQEFYDVVKSHDFDYDFLKNIENIYKILSMIIFS